MVRTPSYDKSGLKKGTWTPEEDEKLKDYVTRYGYWNWRQLPKFAGLARCGKSCRLRWMNYLRPNIKRGNYSKEEEETIIRLHEKLGNRWSAIAAELPGRSDNEIKNHWHTYLKKRPKQNMITSNDTNMNNNDFSQNTLSNDTYPNDDFSQCIESSFSQLESELEGEVAKQNDSHPQIDEMSSYAANSCSTQQNNTEFYSITSDFSETLDSFWSEPFLSETSTMMNDDFTGFFDGELLCQYDNMFSGF